MCVHREGVSDLDAEIARIMCLSEVQRGHLSYWYTPTDCGWTAYKGPCVAKTDIDTWVYQWGPEGRGINSDTGMREVSRYTEDLSAAWEVIEYLRNLGVWFCLFDERCDPPMYRASLCPAGIPLPSVDAVEKHPALAICKAAVALKKRGLKALLKSLDLD